MGKPAFCICENKDADQLAANRALDKLLFQKSTVLVHLEKKRSNEKF